MRSDVHKKKLTITNQYSDIEVQNNEKILTPQSSCSNFTSSLYGFFFPGRKTSDSEMNPLNAKKIFTSRLNQEIQILSSELRQSNDLAAFLNQKLVENNEKNEADLEELKKNYEKQLNSCKNDFENKCKAFSLEIKDLKEKLIQETSRLKTSFDAEIENKEKTFNETMEKVNFEHKKQLLSLENHFIEIIMEMNTKFVNEIERLSCKESRNRKNITKKDFEDGLKLKIPMAKVNNITTKKSEESDCEADNSLSQLLHQIK